MSTLAIPWTASMRGVLERLQHSPMLQRLQVFAGRHRLALFVVGGVIRDVCLGRETQDIDVALAGDAMAVARAFANDIRGAYVPLDPQRGEARVVHRALGTIDFARFRGKDIASDLARRDFTINALACPLTTFLQSSTPALIDPCNGWRDLQARVMRMTSPRSFQEDPLRMLRGFRLAATLDCTIEGKTLERMRPTVPRLAEIAAERINVELFNLFGAPHSAPHGVAMARLGLLDEIFPELAATHGVTQNRYHHLDVFEHSLLAYQSTEAVINSPAPYFSDMADAVEGYVQADDHAALLKWAALLHDIGKPATRRMDTRGRVSFRGHSERGAHLWKQAGRRLRLSAARVDSVKILIAHHRRPLQLQAWQVRGGLTLQLVHRLFKELDADVLGLFVLAVGDALASRGPQTPTTRPVALGRLCMWLWEVYRTRILPVIGAPRLVTGDDLRSAFGLKPGPRFKMLLDGIELLQVEGRIHTREGALRWLEQQLR